MIYLDHHAASPLEEGVREACGRALREAWANPSSTHRLGQSARRLLEEARAQVAEACGVAPLDLIWTSGGTEACNWGVEGLCAGPPARLVTSTIEHPAVEESVQALARRGWRIERLKVEAGRPPGASAIEALGLGPADRLICQWVNHEVGTILPVEDYAAAAKRSGAQVFVDASQALGKLDFSGLVSQVDAFALAAPKIGGPAGAGALWLRRGVELPPRFVGGGQERGRRAGSPDVLACVGFGAAARRVGERLAQRERLGAMQRDFEAALEARGGLINGREAARVPTVSNVSFPGQRAALLVHALDIEGLCVSSGPACSSALAQPSPTVVAMYPGHEERAQAALRFSWGASTEWAELEAALACLDRVLARFRRPLASPPAQPSFSREARSDHD